MDAQSVGTTAGYFLITIEFYGHMYMFTNIVRNEQMFHCDNKWR